MEKFFKIIFYTVATLILGSIATLFLVPLLPIENNIEIKIVKSGSMEPFIETGSIVVIRPASEYKVDDIITFGEDSPDSFPTTHRVVSINNTSGEALYQTKGDANEEADPTQVSERDVIGKVILTVPKAGFVLDFAKKPLGFILMIVVPAALVILNEVVDIWNEIRRAMRKRKKEEDGESPKVLKRIRPMDDVLRPVYRRPDRRDGVSNKVLISSIVFVVAAGSMFARLGGTISYFADTETSLSNVVSAILFEINVESAPTESQVGVGLNSTIVSTINPVPEGLPHQYQVTVEEVGGPSILCAALALDTTDPPPPPLDYNGPLLALTTAPTTYAGEWTFDVSLSDPTGINNGDLCVVDFVYSSDTWLADEAVYGGYSDEERVTLTFEAVVEEEQEQTLQLNSFIDAPLFEEPPLESTVVEEPVVEGEPVVEEEPTVIEEEPVVEEPAAEPVSEELPIE